MADFSDIVDQLKKNNRSEAGRDSRHTMALNQIKETLSTNLLELADNGNTPESESPTPKQESPALQDEKRKDMMTALADAISKSKVFKSLPPLLQDIAKGVGNFIKKGVDKTKGVIGALLKAAGFGLLVAFLNSDTFKKFFSKENISNFVDGIKRLIKGISSFGSNLFSGNFGAAFDDLKKIFNDESGLGKVAIGLAAVGVTIAGFKLAKLFSKIKTGVSALGGFLGKTGSRLKDLALPGGKDKGGLLPNLLPDKNKKTSSVPLGGGPAGKGGGPGRVTRMAKGLSTMGKAAGKSIGTFISGILKSIGAGLTAIANPAVLIGLAALSAAILAVSAAIRIMEPAFEPIGIMMEKFGAGLKEVFGGIAEFVESAGKGIRSVVEGIGVAIGNVVDKLTSMSTAGTEATTKQIKELSNIPADKLFAAAGGIDAMKKALDDFGGGTFTKVADSLFGGNGPIDKLVDLAKNVTPLMKAAEAISVISAAGGDYAMAEAELKRRKRVAELESQLASGDVEGFFNTDADKAKARAELSALKQQKMQLQLSGNRDRNLTGSGANGGAGGATIVTNVNKGGDSTTNMTSTSESLVNPSMMGVPDFAGAP